MSRYPGNNQQTATKKDGNPLLTGILVGLIGGVALSAGVAWIVVKSSPFSHPEQTGTTKHPQLAAPDAATSQSAPAAASSDADAKPRFEFYKVLTDKPGETVTPGAKASDKAQPDAGGTYYLQAGSFSDADEAEQLIVKLTMLDMNTSVQTVTLPGKGVWHRVRVGPFHGADNMNKARTTLKQNGVNATPIRGQ